MGGDLLVDGLYRIVSAADNVGLAVVKLDVLDCGDETQITLRGYGFAPLPSHLVRPYAVGNCAETSGGVLIRRRPFSRNTTILLSNNTTADADPGMHSA